MTSDNTNVNQRARSDTNSTPRLSPGHFDPVELR